LVLLDLKMTDMSGFDVLRWIRNRPETEELKVAIYSSSFVDSDVETACKLGADSFIMKPGSWARQVEFARLLQESLLSEPPSLSPLRALPEYRTCGETNLLPG
jgi:CheY-like chemotaxis protein